MTTIRWQADEGLIELLRRYYQGDAACWPEIQAHIYAELRARGLPEAPRHMRFRLSADGYEVILEDAP